MPVTDDFLFQQNLKRWSLYSIGIVVFISLIVLSGWIFNLPFRASNGLMVVPMNPLTAMCFLAAGATLLLCSRAKKTRPCYILAFSFASLITLTGFFRISDSLFGEVFNVDALLLRENQLPSPGNEINGRMTVNTAFNFVLSGIALLFFVPGKKKYSIFYNYLAIAIGLLTFFFLIGYFYNSRYPADSIRFFPMSVSTAICFILFALALLFARPERSLFGYFKSEGIGGLFARTLIPLTVILPVAIGYFLIAIGGNQNIPAGFEFSVFIITIIISFFFLYWYSTTLLNRMDLTKNADQQKIKQLNEALERTISERNAELSEYKYALDASAIIVITDANGIIQHVNDNYCQNSHFSREEIVGHGHSIINPKQHPVATIDHIWNTISRGRIWRGELINYTKEGGQYWEDTTIVPFLDENHHPVQYVHISNDISERKEAQERILSLNESLIQKEKQLNGLIENNNELIAVLDKDFKIIYRSPNYERITGFSPLESDQIQTVTLMHPEDVPGLFTMGEELMDKPGQSIPVHFRMKNKGGEYMWMEGSTCNLLHDPAINGILFNIRNITERKLAEEKIIRNEKIYRTIAANIPGTTIIIFDEPGNYLLIEGDIIQQLGYDPDKMVGKNYEDILSDELKGQIKTDLGRVFGGEKFSRETIRNERHFIVSFVPLKDSADKIYAAMLVLSDISEIKAAERQVAEINAILEKRVSDRTRQLEQINKELEAFTYSVSHDLRAPLRIIEGFAEFLVQDSSAKLEGNAVQKLQAIQRNTRRMTRLIDDLLKLSGIGTKTLRISEENMEEIVRSVVNEQPEKVQEKITINLKSGYTISCDANLIRQVWVNLISNAVKYSSKKENAAISINALRKDGWIIYNIRDNGAGFDPAYKGKLFSVFQRLHSSSEFEGTGVGLALVQRIISRHEGQVWAEGETDVGAVFYFSLPDSSLVNA